MSKPFYENGLRFSCTRCNRCCRHQPGYVFLSEADLTRLCAEKQMSRQDFIDEYCRIVHIGGFVRLSLKEKPNYDCILWENGGCSVYRNRPLQCQSFPFWGSNLDSREDWERLEAECPGVNIGKLHSKAEIEERLQRRYAEPFLNLDEQ